MASNDIDWSNVSTLGSMTHGILQEKVWQKMDYRGMLKLIEEFKLPADIWMDVFMMKKILVIDTEGNGTVVDRDEVPKEILEDYPEPFDYSSWIERKAKEYTEETEWMLNTIRKAHHYFSESILDIDGEDVAVTVKSILKHYREDDLDWLDKVKNEFEYENPYNDDNFNFVSIMLMLRPEIEEHKRFIETSNWLAMQFGYNKQKKYITELAIADRELAKLEYSLHEDDGWKDQLRYTKPLDRVITQVDAKIYLEEYMDSFRKQKETEELVEVDFSENWDAGFISPDGKVYAKDGPTAAFIHVNLADLIFEKYDIVEDPNYMGKDFQLMSLGWIKFNRQKILCDTYIAKELGRTMLPGITDRQRSRLIEYADITPNKALYLGIHGKFTPKEELENMTDEDFERVFG